MQHKWLIRTGLHIQKIKNCANCYEVYVRFNNDESGKRLDQWMSNKSCKFDDMIVNRADFFSLVRDKAQHLNKPNKHSQWI